MKTKTAEKKFASLNAHYIFDAKKNRCGIEGSLRDIDERKHFEIRLEEAKARAEQSDRLKTAFLHNISHEIRTPMNSIIGFSSMLGDADNSAEDEKSFIQTIRDGCNQLLSIINDIVDISSIEANIIKKNIGPVNINDVLFSLHKQFKLKAEEQNDLLKISPGLINEMAVIQTDNTKFIQILSNLINNALKFTKDGQVEFGYMVNEDMAEFFVSDTGIGIPEDHHLKIFNVFYQVESSLSRYHSGTGLGLAISKAYTELLGGKIWVDSEPGKGSEFHFTLPFKPPVEPGKEKSSLTETLDLEMTSAITILVAEDDDNNFNLIKHQLSGPHIKFLRAKDGEEAVSICKGKVKISLILMDIKMPLMDGYKATQEILKIRPGIPIIAQTAFVADREKALISGCVDFISKPFKKEELITVIKRNIRNGI